MTLLAELNDEWQRETISVDGNPKAEGDASLAHSGEFSIAMLQSSICPGRRVVNAPPRFSRSDVTLTTD